MARKKSSSKSKNSNLAPHLRNLGAQIQGQAQLLAAIPTWSQIAEPLRIAATNYQAAIHNTMIDDKVINHNEAKIAGKLRSYEKASDVLLSSSLEPTLIREIERDEFYGYSYPFEAPGVSTRSFHSTYGIKDWRLSYSHEVLEHMGFDKEERLAIRKDIFKVHRKLFHHEPEVSELDQLNKVLDLSGGTFTDKEGANLLKHLGDTQPAEQRAANELGNPQASYQTPGTDNLETPGFSQLTRCYRNSILIYLFGDLDWILCEGEVKSNADDGLYHDDGTFRYFHAWLKLKRKDGTEVIFEPTSRNFQLSFPKSNRKTGRHNVVAKVETTIGKKEHFVYSDFGAGVPVEVVYPVFSKDAYSPFVEFLPSVKTKEWLYGKDSLELMLRLNSYAYSNMLTQTGDVIDKDNTRMHQDIHYIHKSYHVADTGGMTAGSKMLLQEGSSSNQNILDMMNGIYFLPALLQNSDFWEFIKHQYASTHDLLCQHLRDLKVLQDGKPISLIPAHVMNTTLIPKVTEEAIKHS
jgi:hypothetical protein|tara:strand:+ start:792 stop:2351 length:1560 start_codon:yes stop_codon:yes gene_type:complete